MGANADRTVVRPGERVTLNLDLVPYRGDRFRHSMPLDLPEDLPAGRYSLLVGDGASIDAARLALEPAEPVNFAQALDLLRSFHSRRDLIVLGVYGGPGLSVAGEAMPRLPGSVRSLWGAAASGSAVALRSAVVQEKREAMAVPIQGLVRIDLEVRRREPVAGEDQGAGAAETDVASRDRGQGRRGYEESAIQHLGRGAAGGRGRPAGTRHAGQDLPGPSQTAFLAGTLDGVSVDALGRMQLAPRVDRVASLAEPFLLSAAVHPDGWVVGTGNAGKVLKIDRKGGVTELFTAPEPEVFAVWADPDGTVYAGTSPNGKVYRDPAGKGAKAERLLRSQGETYIWALARAADGSLLVGTGTAGQALPRRRQGARGRSSTTATTPTSGRSRRSPGGDVLAGTAGEGLILRIGPRRPGAHPLRRPGARGRLPGGDGGRHLLRRRDRLRGEPGGPGQGSGPGGSGRRRAGPAKAAAAAASRRSPSPSNRSRRRRSAPGARAEPRRPRAARCSRSPRPAWSRASGASPTTRSTASSGRTASSGWRPASRGSSIAGPTSRCSWRRTSTSGRSWPCCRGTRGRPSPPPTPPPSTG